MSVREIHGIAGATITDCDPLHPDAEVFVRDGECGVELIIGTYGQRRAVGLTPDQAQTLGGLLIDAAERASLPEEGGAS